VEPSDAHFFVASRADGVGAGGPFDLKNVLSALRRHGIKLRDGTSFGLPDHVRMAVAPPATQDALMHALHTLKARA